jgi:hypothetical protein
MLRRSRQVDAVGHIREGKMPVSSRVLWLAGSFLVASPLVGPAPAAPLFPGTCFFLDAGVCQEVDVIAGAAPNVVASGDIIAGTSTADIDRNILASVTLQGGRGIAAAGVFGAIGLQGQVGSLNVPFLSAEAEIRSTLFQNLSGGEARATGFFIIDGGRLQLIAGAGSKVSYDISVSSLVLDENGDFIIPDDPGAPFGAFGQLVATSTGVELTTQGTDIGVVRDTRRATQFNIPLSLQTVDFGIVPNGHFLDITYSAKFTIDVVGFAEAISFEFSDPLNLAGPDVRVFPQITFAPLSPTGIAEPGTMALFAGGLLALGCMYARTRRVH